MSFHNVMVSLFLFDVSAWLSYIPSYSNTNLGIAVKGICRCN